ncbi:Trinucleotide repeat-containing gene 18 protein [Echinococcus granulosus]|uniref:Trinucleotide repeat-containing gene 18 protein n=1 Tax=Echinococcus granulosus TaxID=6210 RepID=W6UMM9_ECHGR|nr:Trinucleotide repeat-containing gene 18 protein [Echinococcus granulosus]EUB62381.1 Trinucleotide repeat-containing gene 18 protein [Echinococcus granulosus]
MCSVRCRYLSFEWSHASRFIIADYDCRECESNGKAAKIYNIGDEYDDDIPSGLNFSPPGMQTQGLPLTVNDHGDSVDGPVVTVSPPPSSPHSSSCDGLVDLTAHNRRCYHLSSRRFEDCSSFNSVPPQASSPLPSSPPLLSSVNNASARNAGEQTPVGRSEVDLAFTEPQSGCDIGVPGTSTPLDLSMQSHTDSSDIHYFHHIADGISCSKRLLERVEKFLDAAINLFANPLDLYTAPQNILSEEDATEAAAAASAAVLARRLREVMATAKKQATEVGVADSPTIPFALSDFYRSLPLREPSFSLVLRHLLCLPEWQALASLRYPTARGKELADQLAMIDKDLTRCKRKVSLRCELMYSGTHTHTQDASLCTRLTCAALKQINLMQRRRAASRQSVAPQTVKSPPQMSPKPQQPPFPNTYTDPNTCPLSLLSMVIDQKGTEPSSPSQVLQMSPLSVDTGTLAETAKVCPLSDLGPRAWTATPPPPPPLQASGSITMRNRSFSFPKRLATPLTAPSINRRKVKTPLRAATSATGVWPPKRRRSEVSLLSSSDLTARHVKETAPTLSRHVALINHGGIHSHYIARIAHANINIWVLIASVFFSDARLESVRVKGKVRCASESVDSCEVAFDVSTSPLRLREQLTIQMKDTADPHQSGSSAHHSAKVSLTQTRPPFSSLPAVSGFGCVSNFDVTLKYAQIRKHHPNLKLDDPRLAYDYRQSGMRLYYKRMEEMGALAATTASLSPSTSSLATIDTSSVSSHHPPQRRPPPPQRTSKSSLRRQRKASLEHFAAPLIAYDKAKLDEAEEEGMDDELLQRPPTPDLRRIDLDLSDLSNGLRILLIEDTHLRAGTLYLEDASTSYSSERDNAHDRQCLIRLDQPEKVESPPPLRLAPGTSSSCGVGGSGGASFFTTSVKRRRLGEVRLHAWQVLQQAVLEVVPASIRQLPPGTRVCAAWSDTLAINLYPGVISEYPDKPLPADNCLCIDFDDGDHREVPLRHIRMLPDHFANLNELGRASCTPIACATNTDTVEVHRSHTSPQLSPVSPKGKRMVSVTQRSRLVNGGTSSLKEPSPACFLNSGGNNWLNNWPKDEEKVKPPLRVIWKPHGRLRKRYNGMPCYRSLRRNRDGLVVRLGDVVKFNSGGNDQAYLGEIKIIYAPRHNELSPLVCASWFYCPEEAGEDGKRVANYEGAVFVTDHTDDNEATCIINRVQIARNYTEYRLSRQGKFTELAKENEKQAPPCEDEPTSVVDDSEEGDSSSDGELPTYFIAGKFDPLTGRVLAWDPDLSTELHLQVSTSPPPPQLPSSPPSPTSHVH